MQQGPKHACEDIEKHAHGKTFWLAISMPGSKRVSTFVKTLDHDHDADTPRDLDGRTPVPPNRRTVFLVGLREKRKYSRHKHMLNMNALCHAGHDQAQTQIKVLMHTRRGRPAL